MSRRRLALAGLAAAVVLAVSIALGSSIISSPSTGTRDKHAKTDASRSPDQASPLPALRKGVVTVKDRKAGFSIAYPRSWKRLTPRDKQVRLLAADGTRRSLLVRVAPVGLTVTQGTLGIVRGLTDKLVRADRGTVLLSQPQAIALDGVPGYRYVYTFSPRGKGQRGGAHLHYFLFQRKRLITLVFQVPGVSALKRDSVLLQRVAATFRVTQ